MAIEETLVMLGELVEASKIWHIGLWNESAWSVCEFIKHAEQKVRCGLPRISATLEQLKENIDAEAITLQDDFVAAIHATHTRIPNLGA
jgi:aryl-alcohol dehydrogenase-like predicted oxidoreductase